MAHSKPAPAVPPRTAAPTAKGCPLALTPGLLAPALDKYISARCLRKRCTRSLVSPERLFLISVLSRTGRVVKPCSLLSLGSHPRSHRQILQTAAPFQDLLRICEHAPQKCHTCALVQHQSAAQLYHYGPSRSKYCLATSARTGAQNPIQLAMSNTLSNFCPWKPNPDAVLGRPANLLSAR